MDSIFDYSTQIDDPVVPTRPDFSDMKNWTKLEIDQHAESIGIHLDRRITKEAMIEKFKEQYDAKYTSKNNF